MPNGPGGQNEKIWTFSDVLEKERRLINGRRKRLGLINSEYERGLTGLALSGGGIRSASFCLGVMRALAKDHKLKSFDYLSTVSGGGFAGAFVSRWVHEKGYEEVEEGLRSDTGFADPNSPLYHLRSYISYLTPRVGLFSLDSLAGAGIYFRNLLLNWLVFVPFVFAAVVAAQIVHYLFLLAATDSVTKPNWLMGSLLFVCLFLMGWTFAEFIKYRPGWGISNEVRSFPKLLISLGLTLFCASFLFAITALMSRVGFNSRGKFLVSFIAAAVVFLSFMQAVIQTSSNKRQLSSGWIFTSGVALAIQGALIALLLSSLPQYLDVEHSKLVQTVQYTVILAPLVFITVVYTTEILYVLLMTDSPKGDLEREWLARSTGAQFRLPLAWVFFGAAVIVGPAYIDLNFLKWIFGEKPNFDYPGLSAMTGIAGTITVWLARAKSSLAVVSDKYETIKEKGARWVLAVSFPVFLFGAIALLAQINSGIIKPLILSSDKFLDGYYYFNSQSEVVRSFLGIHVDLELAAMLVILLCSIFAGLVADYFVDINKYSLHGTYRNRIIRTFLGASNDAREPGGFLDFDENDNLELNKLRFCKLATKSQKRITPQIHIINMAMNVPASPQLVLQERKALPFAASPIAVGSRSLCGVEDSKTFPEGCYRRAGRYGKGNGIAISLGTATAISGAAFNSNMGYHSSSALNLLLTFFNMRLGAWLGSPGPSGSSTYLTDGPKFAVRPLMEEALGLAAEDKPYVHLSDGGHFDNLGLYELIARKCSLIVVVDAGADLDRSLQDLGVAERLAFLDLGARIDFPDADLLKIKEKEDCIAVGCINYQDCDYRGRLIYIKPNIATNVPASVFAYGRNNPQFPHEPTVDQWFNESQFNAYLQMGELIGARVSIELWNR